MPQAFLGSNPGTQIEDALAPSLMAAETVNNETTTGEWTEVNFPGKVAVVLDLGALAATKALTVRIEGADDDADSYLEVLGVFGPIDGDDDGQERVLLVAGWKRYMRAVAINSAAVDAVVTSVTVVPAEFHQSNTRTA